MQVIKPATVSVLHSTYGFQGEQFVVSAMSFFKLGEDNRPLPENKQWSRLRPFLDKQVILDTGHAKAVGEILLAGSAYAPKGEPVTKMLVSLQVGNVTKSLQVIGNRSWSGKTFMGWGSASDPEPFTTMPLEFQQAYGGSGYALNPPGKGVISSTDTDAKSQNYPLPNLYLIDESLKADKAPRSVACFLPLAVDHPSRMQFQGTFDQKWLDNVHPGFPDDTNPLVFNAASQDQQNNDFFMPGEEYCIVGMHPKQPELKGRIPDMYVRAFVTQISSDDQSEQFKEITTHIDTLWFFPELELGIAIHRGVMPAKDSAAQDIKNLILALEETADEPRPLSYFQEVRDLRLDKTTAVGHVFNASQLLPQLKPNELLRRAALFAAAKKQEESRRLKFSQQLLKKLKIENPDVDWDKATENAKAESIETPDTPPPPIPQTLIDEGDFDLSPYLAWAKAQHKKALTNIKNAQKQLAVTKAVAKRVTPDYETDEAILARVEDIVPVVTVPTPPAVDTKSEDEATAQPSAVLASGNKMMARKARQTAPDHQVKGSPLPPHGGRLIRERVIALMDNGESLMGRDLAGADLSELHFAGQDLRDVMLEGADLSGASFSRCQLDGAALTAALLENTVFSECSFKRANLSNAKCSQSSFTGCRFDHSCMVQSQFSQCDFSGSKLIKIQTVESDWEQSLFFQVECQAMQWVDCNLNLTCWQQAKLIQMTFLQCQFQESDWQKSALFRCVMVKSKAQKANFCGANGQRVQFSTAGDFTGAEFSAGNWEQCGFRGLNLSQSDLSASVFKSCDFGDADLSGARLSGSLLHNSLLFNVNFENSDCSETVFYQSNLRKSQFKKASLKAARLEQSNLREVIFEDCDTEHLQRSKTPSLT